MDARLETLAAAMIALDTAGSWLPGPDADAGQYLARRAPWTGCEAAAAHYLLQSYQGELTREGVELPAEPPPTRPRPNHVTIEGNGYIVHGRTTPEFVRDLERAIRKEMFSFRGGSRTWRIRIGRANTLALFEIVLRHKIDFGPEFLRSVRQWYSRAKILGATSGALSASERYVPPVLGVALRPYQHAGVEYGVRAQRWILGDPPGLGKTFQALAWLESLQAYPAVVVVPPVALGVWLRHARWALPNRVTEGWAAKIADDGRVVCSDVETSRPPGDAADIVVLTYEALSSRGKRRTGSVKDLAVAAELKDKLHPKAVVADEAHKLANNKSLRSQAVRRLIGKCKNVALLTGTPVTNRPSDLINLLVLVGRLDEFGGYVGFIRRYCGATRGTFGWELGKAQNLDDLHRKLRENCYVRRAKRDVLTELPPKQFAVVPIEPDNRAAYERLEERTLREMRAMGFGGESLMRVNALRLDVAKRKLSGVIAWIREFLDKGEKLVVFAWHKEVIGRLGREFPGALIIDGSVPKMQRTHFEHLFQTEPAAQLLVANIEAGGVSLTLTAASNCAFVEFPWRPAELVQAEDRIHRIGQDDPATIWYLVAPRTIDDHMLAVLREKSAVTRGVEDGQKGGEDASVREEIFRRMAKVAVESPRIDAGT